MKKPADIWRYAKQNISGPAKAAFLSAVTIGLAVHLPIMLSDIPNHDGLASIYFDQNMITSGRWFLTIACGISSYYTLPWLIGLLGMVYLGIAAAVLTDFLEIKRIGTAVLAGGFLVSFPALASTFAYVFTLDGYMLAVLLAVLAPYLAKKRKYGFVPGGICLAFSLGIYQSYLPFAMLLSLYGVIMILLTDHTVKEKMTQCLRYVYMGGIGVGLYYVLLRLLLLIQGKQLASYQGIDGMGEVGRRGLLESLKLIYTDFAAFSLRGHVIYNSLYSGLALAVLAALVLAALFVLIRNKKLWKSPWLYVSALVLALLLPFCTNVILLISPDVTYHLLMRYQWVLYLILGIAFAEKYLIGHVKRGGAAAEWLLLLAAGVLVFHFAVTDQIAYSNLEKKYEKTYALCLRLADRMEQTPGYEQGMPVAMIGVVGDAQYPLTDVSGSVTLPMIGMSGDYLLYTRTNYQAFFRHYLGITVELVSDEQMVEIYNSPEYQSMGSFPAADSVKVVDGILYVKLENSGEE